MKTTHSPCRFLLSVAILQVAALSARSVTFTNDTSISFSNSNYDGQEIVITNCTVTIDGSHAFANVHILNGGTLTHSFAANGQLENRVSVTGEQHIISDTNPPTLNQPNVFTNTIVVTDIPGSTTYTQGVDYAVTNLPSGLTQLSRVPGSAIPDGSTISVGYDFLGQPVATGLNLAVTNDFEIEPGGAINANGKGYGAGAGPGAGASSSTNFPYSYFAGSGAGHGGYGGSSSTLAGGGNCYGSIIA